MSDDRSVEITVDAFLRVKRERDEARAAVRAIAARCWMLRQVARESDTALRAEREEVARLRRDAQDDAESALMSVHHWSVDEAFFREDGQSCCAAHGYKRERDAAIARAEAAEATIAAVRALHPALPIRLGPDAGKAMCGSCGTDVGFYPLGFYPCPTIRALDTGATT